MATTLTSNLHSNVGTTPVAVVSSDSLKTTTILGLNLCNKTPTPITVDGYIRYSSNNYYVFKNLSVDGTTTVVAIGDNQRLILGASQSLYVVASANTSLDVIVSSADTPVL